jgi:ribosomal protein L16/L10AE
MKKATRRSDKTFRKSWMCLFPVLPLSKKSHGMRMGKGKGKRQTWFVRVHPGTFFFEFRNVRKGRIVFFLKQLQYRIPLPTTIVFKKLMCTAAYNTPRLIVPVLPFW